MMRVLRRFQRLILGAGLLLAACTASAGESQLERTFARGVYWPWELTSANAKAAGKETWQFADDFMATLKNQWHVNVIWFVNGPDDPARACDLAAKHGILVLIGTPLSQYMSYGLPSESELAKAAQAATAPLREKKALAAYVLKDEPLSREVEQQETYRRLLAQADPARPSIAVTMTGDTETYIARAGFPIACTDIYHFGGPQSPNIPNPASVSQQSYRGAVGALVEMAVHRGKIPWSMPQSFADPQGPWWLDEQKSVVIEPGCYWHWRMPTAAEIHWQTWEAVRAGCRGVVYFHAVAPENNWTPDKGPMPADFQKNMDNAKRNKWPVAHARIRTGEPACLTRLGGESTAQARAVGEDFALLERIEETLLSLRPTHLRVAFVDSPAAINTFETVTNPALRYAVVVSDDLQAARTLTIRFLPHVAAVKDLRDNTALTLADEAVGNAGFRTAALKLGPGEGTILQLEFRGGTPGLCLFHEDFSQAAMSVTLENAERRIEPRAFGMGWQCRVRKADAQGKEGKIVLSGLEQTPGAATPLAGALSLAAKGAENVFLYVEGQFPQAESLVVNFLDKDGKGGWNKTNNYYLPCRVPPETRSIELLVRPDAVVKSVSVWRAPRAADGK